MTMTTKMTKTMTNTMTMTKQRLAATLPLALAGALLSPVADAALPAGISGTWFNPDQSGHGLSIEILPANRALTFWYSYDHDGNPLLLYVDGTIHSNRIEGVAYAPQGMRFGEFDPDALQKPVWGTLTIEFDDCNNGTLQWDSTLPEFGSGSMPLIRLSAIDGLACDMAEPDREGKGLYTASLSPSRNGAQNPGIAAVDGYGKVWAIDFGYHADTSPGPGWVSSATACVATGSVNLAGGTMPSALRETPNAWHYGSGPSWSCDDRGWSGQAQVLPDGFVLSSAGALDGTQWRFRERSGVELVTPLTLADTQGEYRVALRSQFNTMQTSLRVDTNGAVCIDMLLGANGPAYGCLLTGQLSIDERDPGFLDLWLSGPGGPVYRGRGWLEDRTDGRRLVLIGTSDTGGMAIVAQ